MANFKNLVLVFCYIFGFRFYGSIPFDSTMLVGLFVLVYTITHGDFFKLCIDEFLKPRNLKIFLLYIFINCWCFVCLIVNQSADISFLVTFLHMIFIIAIGMLLFLYFKFNRKERFIINYIIIAFVLQTAIEWSAFTFEPFKEIINSTKNIVTIEKGNSYGNIRANALAGSDFFGLSSAFAAIYLIYFSSLNTLFKNSINKNLCFLFILTGTFFAGRSGYLGLIMALFYLALNKIVYLRINRPYTFNLTIKQICKTFILVAMFLIILMIAISNYANNIKIEQLFRFTFQSFFVYADRGSLMTSSLNQLSNMYFEIPISTLIFGDGKYMAYGGKYYMSTDVGYMRTILYMGILGLILLGWMQVKLMKIQRSKEKLLKVCLLALIFILNFKGEVLVWNQILLAIVVLYSNENIQDNELVSKR